MEKIQTKLWLNLLQKSSAFEDHSSSLVKLQGPFILFYKFAFIRCTEADDVHAKRKSGTLK